MQHSKLSLTLSLFRISTPEQHILSGLQILDVSHTYDLYNAGPSPMEKAIVHICLPFVGQIELLKCDTLQVQKS
jgi:hypothetical protein